MKTEGPEAAAPINCLVVNPAQSITIHCNILPPIFDISTVSYFTTYGHCMYCSEIVTPK